MSNIIADNIQFYLHILEKTSHELEVLQKIKTEKKINNENDQKNDKLIKNLLEIKEE